ncbi:putative transcriptional regulator [Opitutaceae bacterium TAV1]|nr:putative transcriptional regulator [Opitutaceae bacterium TAV1]
MSGNSRFAVSVHVLAYLAYKAGASVTSAEIASSVDTNPVVIRRQLSALVRARLVIAHKGASGGFSLTSAPANITLLDIHRAVEPQPAHSLARFAPNHKCPVGARIETILRAAFFKAQAGMEAELARISLADILQQLKSVCTGKH